MKKIVLVCGLIAGFIEATMMLITLLWSKHTGNHEGSLLLGYATMLVAFSLIFVGIKNYRDKNNNGVIKLGQAFEIGFYITLIASTVYVATWLVEYYIFFPDFMEKYTGQILQQTKASGAGQVEISNKAAEMARYKEMYKDPLMVVLLTYAEILPVGLVVTLISALLLKRKASKQMATA